MTKPIVWMQLFHSRALDFNALENPIRDHTRSFLQYHILSHFCNQLLDNSHNRSPMKKNRKNQSGQTLGSKVLKYGIDWMIWVGPKCKLFVSLQTFNKNLNVVTLLLSFAVWSCSEHTDMSNSFPVKWRNLIRCFLSWIPFSICFNSRCKLPDLQMFFKEDYKWF